MKGCPILAVLEVVILFGAGAVALGDGVAIRAFVRPRQRGAYDVLGPDGYLMVVGCMLILVAVAYGSSIFLQKAPSARARGAIEGGARVGSVKAIVLTLATMCVYVALIPVAGYLLSTVLFLFFVFRVAGVTSWLASALFSVVLATAFSLVFVRLAGMPLPKSIIGIG